MVSPAPEQSSGADGRHPLARILAENRAILFAHHVPAHRVDDEKRRCAQEEFGSIVRHEECVKYGCHEPRCFWWSSP